MSDESSIARGRRATAGRLLAVFFWYALPAIAAFAVAAYIVGAILWHVNPPIVPVEGVSMRPTLQPGDLVFLKGVDPELLRKGNVIAVRVPSEARSQYGLPGEIVHRIVRVQKTLNGLLFVTKGDANTGNDVFTTPASDIVGREVMAVPGLGYPFLFFRSKQGEIFAAAVVAVGILYFLLGVFEERRAFSEGTVVAFETILAETTAVKEAIAATGAAVPPPLQPPPEGAPIVTPSAVPVGATFEELVEQVQEGNLRGLETSEVMRELVGAIGEYGTHLRSHTEVMVNLAATTRELQEATVEMRGAIMASALPRVGAERSDLTEPTALPPAPSAPPAGAELPVVAEPPPTGPAGDADLAAAPQAAAAAEPRTAAGPDAVQSLALKRAFRGYSTESVDVLLTVLTRRLGMTEQRLAEFARRNMQLEQEVTRYQQLEASIAGKLKAAEKASAELRERAEHQAREIVAAAQERAAEATLPAEEQTNTAPTRRDDIGEGIYLPAE